jgi:hypothetical protein
MKPILTAAALVAALCVPAAADTFPPQHWASKGGVVTVLPNRVHDYTLRQLSDIEAIRDLFHHWAMYYDEGRNDLLPTILTEDVVVTVLLGKPEPIAVLEGIPAVTAFNQGSLDAQRDQRRHVMSNIMVDGLTERTARATAFGTVVKLADGLSIGAMVLYVAELARSDDGLWRFHRLTIGIDDYEGNLAGTSD